LLLDQGDPAQAEAEFRTALKEQQALVKLFPAKQAFRGLWAGCHHDLGVALAMQGRRPEAEAA
jgi:Tetratricopeptide repeat